MHKAWVSILYNIKHRQSSQPKDISPKIEIILRYLCNFIFPHNIDNCIIPLREDFVYDVSMNNTRIKEKLKDLF